MKIFFITILLCASVFGQVQVEELGRFNGEGGRNAKFINPSGIDISEDGRIFVADRFNHRIAIFDANGFFVRDVGGLGWQNEQFDEPADLWARSTIDIFVADYNNQRVQRFDREMNFISTMYSNEGSDERFQFMEVLSVAYSPQGDLFILDGGDRKIIKFYQGTGKSAFGYFGSGPGELKEPVQIDLTSDHFVIASDRAGKCVNVYDYFGTFIRKIKHENMSSPSGIALDRKNRIYVADPVANCIFVFSPEGKPVARISQIPKPEDLALKYKEKDLYTAYVISGDEVIIANLKINAAN